MTTMTSTVNSSSVTYGDPIMIQEGIFGATFVQNGEPLFLRMELITNENTEHWTQFKISNYQIANLNSRGILSVLVNTAGKNSYPNEEVILKNTGFNKEEAFIFREKAIKLKETNQKIAEVIAANCVGGNHMNTRHFPNESCYVVYITKNPSFSIQNVKIDPNEFTLKKYIETYGDILISVGSNFSAEGYFNQRGISRNPYWVFEKKYSGLSMLLHGFTAKVATNYFPEKNWMRVTPVGSMQSIIVKSLLPGDGYIRQELKEIDLTQIKVSPDDPEGSINYIKTTALVRIYHETITRFQSASNS